MTQEGDLAHIVLASPVDLPQGLHNKNTINSFLLNNFHTGFNNNLNISHDNKDSNQQD
jgi:hypothetical protein